MIDAAVNLCQRPSRASGLRWGCGGSPWPAHIAHKNERQAACGCLSAAWLARRSQSAVV